jgi:peroxiredoxin
MKTSLARLSALALLAVAPPPARAAGEDLQGAVEVSGRTVEVRLRHRDGRPACAVQVRLLYAGKRAVAAGHTDGQGRWAHTVERTGAYEVMVEGGPGGQETLRLPFTVLDPPPARPVPWGTAVAGLACLAGALVLFLFRIGPAARRRLVPLRAALLAAGVGFLGWSAWRQWLEPGAPAAPADPDVAAAARAFLRDRKVKPLSEPLARLLADEKTERVQTQPHPLLGRPAPDFELTDPRQQVWRLRERLGRGPVVLVFYYGYYCNHCVAQLFALHDDFAKFRELGAEVVAVSADPPELTRERFRQYGAFAFPLLSDPGNKVGRVYGVYRPAAGETPEDLRHGTFVIGRDGRVHWAHCGYQPFTGNRTLLYELARLEGRLPPRKDE